MSWLGLQNNLDKVGSKLDGLSEAADAVTQKISSAARQLSALQDQQRSFTEQFGKPGPQIPGMTSEQSRAFAEQFGKPGPQIPGMTSEQSRAFSELFGKPGQQVPEVFNQLIAGEDAKPQWAETWSDKDWNSFKLRSEQNAIEFKLNGLDQQLQLTVEEARAQKFRSAFGLPELPLTIEQVRTQQSIAELKSQLQTISARQFENELIGIDPRNVENYLYQRELAAFSERYTTGYRDTKTNMFTVIDPITLERVSSPSSDFQPLRNLSVKRGQIIEKFTSEAKVRELDAQLSEIRRRRS